MIDAGHTLYAPTPEEVQLWRDAAAPLVDQWKKDAAARGVDAEATYKAYSDALAAKDAKF